MNTRELARFLAEDINRGDVTSAILSNKKITATIIARQGGIIAGAKHTKEIFAMKKCRVHIMRDDGQTIKANQVVLQITGPARSILSCERTALNLLSRMSGIATATNQLVRQVKKISKKTDIYSTRKTAPGLRFFDKEAVEIGGGRKHRVTLSDMIMIKDNHIAAEGSIVELIRRAKKRAKVFEVEVDTFSDAILAATLGVPIIMLDNFSPDLIKKTIKQLERMHLRKNIRLEASGGINIQNIREFAKTGVDMISVGSITNSVKAVDFSLEV
ncbi:carboxylating nicotinate-nucleotide diphosphorylase [Candidatus Nitrosotenuis aquarius]|uniref:carboxylating nicotinate-nucleotide diphosphorylase n=1 Tax=Candidatus Nitrosotenuis aquarius TaxID=1846278 RepID=UPI000C1F69CD|nr:carboxylating nicotinate-nucleotide diphosphorylase [Candidatus Nitrosotenuis aquarius]